MQINTHVKNSHADLQRSLAEVDLSTRSSSGNMMELLILKFCSIAIRMDRHENHARPHLHIDYGRKFHTATYSVDTGERLVGSLARKYDKRISVWIKRNRANLMELWNRMRSDLEYKAICIELREDKP